LSTLLIRPLFHNIPINVLALIDLNINTRLIKTVFVLFKSELLPKCAHFFPVTMLTLKFLFISIYM